MNPPDQPTPRTDAALLSSDCAYGCAHSFQLLIEEKYDRGKCVCTGPDIAHGNDGVVVLADFARTLERELAAEREKVRVLREALENLRDEQNGAPLCTREEQWTQAMDRADAALAATEGAK